MLSEYTVFRGTRFPTFLFIRLAAFLAHFCIAGSPNKIVWNTVPIQAVLQQTLCNRWLRRDSVKSRIHVANVGGKSKVKYNSDSLYLFRFI